MGTTEIEWTESVWNPVRGCSHVSEGCRNCYAERQAARFAGKGQPYAGLVEFGERIRRPRWTGDVRFVPEMLEVPLRWRKPRQVFVNSMSDLFHEGVSDGEVFAVWRIMAMCQQHVFQVLTKRPQRMLEWFQKLADVEPFDVDVSLARGPDETRKKHSSGRAHLFADWLETLGPPPPGAAYPTYDWADGPRWWSTVLPNLWLGVSVEDQATAEERIPLLLQTPASLRWVSCEPLLGEIVLDHLDADRSHPTGSFYQLNALTGRNTDMGRPCRDAERVLDWVVVGGESGPGARPMNPEWVLSIRDQCTSAGVPFFFKQWGGVRKKAAGRLLDGREWGEMPTMTGGR
jgi:protein gp37